MNQVILEAVGLKKYFPIRKGLLLRQVGSLKAVDGVSIQVKKSQTLGIVGESGCGKSTLGRTLIRLYDPTEGKISLFNKEFHSLSQRELRPLRKHIQMIFQDPYASLNPRHTVAQILEEPFRVHGLGTADERRIWVSDLMQKVGLNAGFVNRYPHEFSGGQRQRISIARAIALKPDIIIADEPVSALDVSIQAQVLNLMKDLQAEMNLSFVFISHDLGVVRHMSDEVAVMYLGKIVEHGPTEELFQNPRHPYTRALLASVPEMGKGKRTKHVGLKGDVPSPLHPPSGCSFHPRCSLATERCSNESPELVEVSTKEGAHGFACWNSKE